MIDRAMQRLYVFRYLHPDAKTYVIYKKDKPTDISPASTAVHHPIKPMVYREIYSEPFIRTNSAEIRNTVLAFQDPWLCEIKRSHLLAAEQTPSTYDLGTEEMQLMCLKDRCSMLQMPLNVVMNISCDLQSKTESTDVFYHIERDHK
jgi:hypothetical protein